MNVKKFAVRFLSVQPVVFATMASSHAALPTVVTDAITAAGDDLAAAATAVISAMVVFWGLYKVGKKMGWW
jgi:hypothetical protein